MRQCHNDSFRLIKWKLQGDWPARLVEELKHYDCAIRCDAAGRQLTAADFQGHLTYGIVAPQRDRLRRG